MEGAQRFRAIGCYFEAGANDAAEQIRLGAFCDGTRISSSTIISTAPTVAAQPKAAIMAVGNLTSTEIADTVISGGTVGFSNYWAIDLNAGTALDCRFTNLSLLLGADMRMGPNATGHVNVQLATGGSRVDWS